MRRLNRQKAKKTQAPHDLWNQMWQAFCPWVVAPTLKPAPIARPNVRLKAFAGALLAVGLFVSTDAKASEFNSENQIVLAALSNTVPSDRAVATPGLFGSSEQRYTDIRPFTKWTGTLNRFKREFADTLDQQETKDWMKLLSSLKDASPSKKIEAVNVYMNQVKFVPDTKNYGSSDYWATPAEFLKNGGDCEDYALAKYISLRALGFSQNEMRLAIVYDSVMRMPHALLIVYDNGEAKVLDNQTPAIMDSAEISRYKPIYSISQVAWWRH